ncbi:hypothetical protein BH24BAC1_BH24BAC1_12610 [soil metagenome]
MILFADYRQGYLNFKIMKAQTKILLILLFCES